MATFEEQINDLTGFGTNTDRDAINDWLQAGVRKIEVSNICTACHLEDWYSHRGEKGMTGRFGALISL